MSDMSDTSDSLSSAESITSPQNPRVKFWVDLRKDGQKRREAGLFQLEGLRAVEALAARAPESIDTLIVSWKEIERQAPEALARAQAIAAQVAEAGGHQVDVSRDVFQKIADVESPQGIMAIAKIPAVAIVELVGRIAEANALAVAGVAVNDPGNLGTLLRSAAAFGAEALFALEGSVDPYHPKVLRASAGHLIPAARGPWAEFRAACTEHGVRVIGVALPREGQKALALDKLKVKKSEAVVLCVGGEANGFPETAQDFDEAVQIPMQETVESLNAGVAGSIALYQLRRK